MGPVKLPHAQAVVVRACGQVEQVGGAPRHARHLFLMALQPVGLGGVPPIHLHMPETLKAHAACLMSLDETSDALCTSADPGAVERSVALKARGVKQSAV